MAVRPFSQMKFSTPGNAKDSSAQITRKNTDAPQEPTKPEPLGYTPEQQERLSSDDGGPGEPTTMRGAEGGAYNGLDTSGLMD